MGDSGAVPLVVVVLGILFLLIGIGLGFLNGAILGTQSNSSASQHALFLSNLEVFGLVIAGLFGIGAGIYMTGDP